MLRNNFAIASFAPPASVAQRQPDDQNGSSNVSDPSPYSTGWDRASGPEVTCSSDARAILAGAKSAAMARQPALRPQQPATYEPRLPGLINQAGTAAEQAPDAHFKAATLLPKRNKFLARQGSFA
jgi:hypothetical protein